MKTNIGEEGTEQFTITTYVDGKMVGSQPIQDPFIRTRVTTGMSRWEHFKRMFTQKPVITAINVDGSEGVNRVIMTLDPVQMQKDTEEILEERRIGRESRGVMGHYAETPSRN